MKYFTVPLLGICLAVLYFSCDTKSGSLKMTPENIWDCHHAIDWDSSGTANELTGLWKWEFLSCWPGHVNDLDNQGLEIEFHQDKTLQVTNNGVILQTSNWKLIKVDGGLYGLEVEPFVDQLFGRILFCDDVVEFNGSYIDACDHYFRKED